MFCGSNLVVLLGIRFLLDVFEKVIEGSKSYDTSCHMLSALTQDMKCHVFLTIRCV